MRRRQTTPKAWLIVADSGADAVATARRAPRGGGILVLDSLPRRELRSLRQVARQRDLSIVIEGRRTAARVHNVRELRRARVGRVPLILLSPIFSTASHPDRKPIPRMRAAALARLGGRRLIALGGMNPQRYATVARLGFVAWAGISAFRT